MGRKGETRKEKEGVQKTDGGREIGKELATKRETRIRGEGGSGTKGAGGRGERWRDKWEWRGMQRDLFLVPEALNCTCRLLLLHLCVRSYYARWRTTLVSTPISRHLHESAVACTKAIYVSLSRYASSSNSGSGDPAAGGEKATQAEAARAEHSDGAEARAGGGGGGARQRHYRFRRA